MKFFHNEHGILYLTQLPSIVRGKEDDDFKPAYTLGYLLRRLPMRLPADPGYWLTVGPFDEERWGASYLNGNTNPPQLLFNTWTYTPEDAAAKLAIELFKQGVLTRDGDE